MSISRSCWQKALQADGFAADALDTASDAPEGLIAARYAALILDLGSPDGDGLFDPARKFD
jgi:DNA-binding response OmpR family regulator